MSFVGFDLETACSRPYAAICEIGLVRVVGGEIADRWVSLVRPPNNAYHWAEMRIHGIHPKDTEDSLSFDGVWPEARDFIGDLPLVAHNILFDRSVLSRNFAAYGLPALANPWYCTCQLSRKLFPGVENHKLKTLCECFGINRGRAHRADSDAESYSRLAILSFMRMFELVGEGVYPDDLAPFDLWCYAQKKVLP